MKTFRNLFAVLCAGLFVASCATAPPRDAGGAGTLKQWRHWLARGADRPLIPELQTVTPSALAQTERGKEALQWAGSASRDIPETTEALYNRYREVGERPPYEKPYFAKRTQLAQFVIAAWLTPEQADIEHIAALLESILAEPTWVVPAHERDTAWNIDLFASETASELAHVMLLIGDRLPGPLQQRIRAEVCARVLDPYLAHAREYGWNRGLNNWTGVCSGSIGEVFLILEADPERLATALMAVAEQQNRFLENAFTEEGACLEGIGYWNYGLLHLVFAGEMIRAHTNGAVDLLANPKLEAIAKYPSAMALDRHVFASFADSHEGSQLVPCLATRLAERTGEKSLLAQMGTPFAWRLSTVLRNLLWSDWTVPQEPAIEEVYWPQSGLIKLVGASGGKRLVLAAKAGHNNEPHNNNDIGSFILRIGGATYLCDPGAGLYSREYFGPKRYENLFTSSLGHSVPRINGQLQKFGAEFRGQLERTAPNAFHIRFEEAYGQPELKRAERCFTVNADGTVTMETSYESDGSALAVEEAFMTWQEVSTEGAVARIETPEGTLEIRADTGEFSSQRFEKECRDNRKEGTLTRIALMCPRGAKAANRYTFVYVPR